MNLWSDVGTTLPPVDLSRLAAQAMTSHGAVALHAGYGILTLGLLARLQWAYFRSVFLGEAARYAQAICVVACLALLTSRYQAVATTLIRLVTLLGDGFVGDASLDQVFYGRMLAYNAYDIAHGSEGVPLPFLSMDGFVTACLKAVTLFLFIAVQAVAYILRCLQIFGLAVIILYGPLLLGVAVLGPFFMPLAIGWFWALVEISAWSLTSAILLNVFGEFARDIPSDFNTATEITVCAVMLVFFIATPVLTSMLIRGSTAASLGQSTALLAVGAARTGMQVARASPPYLKAQALAAAGSRAMDSTLSRGVGAAGSWMRQRQAASPAMAAAAAPAASSSAGAREASAAPARRAAATSLASAATEHYLSRNVAGSAAAGSPRGAPGAAPRAPQTGSSGPSDPHEPPMDFTEPPPWLS